MPLEQGAEAEWRVGGRGLKLEDLILVGLEHVSMGSWQPHFRLMKKVELATSSGADAGLSGDDLASSRPRRRSPRHPTSAVGTEEEGQMHT